MDNTVACEPVRKEKHLEIHEAIQHLDSITNQLDNLIFRLEGPSPTESNDKDVSKEPTFIDILNGGAGQIREKTENSHKRIAKLNEMLF